MNSLELESLISRANTLVDAYAKCREYLRVTDDFIHAHKYAASMNECRRMEREFPIMVPELATALEEALKRERKYREALAVAANALRIISIDSNDVPLKYAASVALPLIKDALAQTRGGLK